jgi:hypothetical protein
MITVPPDAASWAAALGALQQPQQPQAPSQADMAQIVAAYYQQHLLQAQQAQVKTGRLWSHHARVCITATNRIHLILFGEQNRT